MQILIVPNYSWWIVSLPRHDLWDGFSSGSVCGLARNARTKCWEYNKIYCKVHMNFYLRWGHLVTVFSQYVGTARDSSGVLKCLGTRVSETSIVWDCCLPCLGTDEVTELTLVWVHVEISSHITEKSQWSVIIGLHLVPKLDSNWVQLCNLRLGKLPGHDHNFTSALQVALT